MSETGEVRGEQAPLARIGDSALESLPADLYIPPEAMRVMLVQFEGPLDLLLWLIRRNRFDILDIPIAEIARQYEHYIELMQALDIELAAEYLFMAAWLAEIKSRMLLPRPELELLEEEEEDPRLELMQRLLQYEGYRQAAQWLDGLNRAGRDIWPVQLGCSEQGDVRHPPVEIAQLCQALGEVIQRQQWEQAHAVKLTPVELEDKVRWLLDTLPPEKPVSFAALLMDSEGRLGVAVTFMALLELLRQRVITVHQPDSFAPIEIVRVAT